MPILGRSAMDPGSVHHHCNDYGKTESTKLILNTRSLKMLLAPLLAPKKELMEGPRGSLGNPVVRPIFLNFSQISIFPDLLMVRFEFLSSQAARFIKEAARLPTIPKKELIGVPGGGPQEPWV